MPLFALATLAIALGTFQNAHARGGENFGYIHSNDPIKDTVPIISLNASTIASIPRSVDWRGKYVTPVRDQGPSKLLRNT